MKIWIHINGVQEGPYELNELPLDRMNAETPVWYDGLEYWQPAGEAKLTEGLFGSSRTGAPVSNTVTAVNALSAPAAKKPATYLWWSFILTILGGFNVVGILAIVFGIMVNMRWNNYDEAGAKRASERAAWCVMLLIVTDLMFAPLSFLTMLM